MCGLVHAAVESILVVVLADVVQVVVLAAGTDALLTTRRQARARMVHVSKQQQSTVSGPPPTATAIAAQSRRAGQLANATIHTHLLHAFFKPSKLLPFSTRERNSGLNWTIPELVKSNVGSPVIGLAGKSVWPKCSA